jgi:PAS domain-containing protein
MTSADGGRDERTLPRGAIQLRTFPSGDAEFRMFARLALTGLHSPTTETLQRAIRERYPAAVVRVQSELARRGGGAQVWYTFRHGTVAPAAGGSMPFDWDAPGVAWAIIDDDRCFLDLNQALADIVEVPRESIVGHAIEEFTNPGDPTVRDDLVALWTQFVRAGSAESSIRFNRNDGRPRQLAYRIVANEAGPSRHRLRVREIDPD